MSNLANDEEPVGMPLNSLGYALFVNAKTIFKERNTTLFVNYNM